MTTRPILDDKDGKPTEAQSLALCGLVVACDDDEGAPATRPARPCRST